MSRVAVEDGELHRGHLLDLFLSVIGRLVVGWALARVVTCDDFLVGPDCSEKQKGRGSRVSGFAALEEPVRVALYRWTPGADPRETVEHDDIADREQSVGLAALVVAVADTVVPLTAT